ncbi:hypothetical protein AbraIFM66950_006719 [Aspergillus brasiliensis]|nr:hypothetical protein AbraIFM66950_006719 [Aspergillus brasiliensis]
MTITSDTRKTIAIYGATGAQGSSVINSLLQNQSQPFHIRGITRDPSSSSSQALAAKGVTLVQGDGWDPETLREAFRGSWAAFVNTNSYDPKCNSPTGPTEYDLGRGIVDAAAAAGVKIFIYSSGIPTLQRTDGQVEAHELDKKYHVEQYARSLNQFDAVIAIMPGMYLENLLHPVFARAFGGFPLEANTDGVMSLTAPPWGRDTVGWPFLSVTEDFGDLVHGVLLDPLRWKDARVQGVSVLKPLKDMAEAFTRVTGKEVRYSDMPSLESFNLTHDPMLESGESIIHYMCVARGGYFDEKGDEVETAAELKRLAVKAKGGDESTASLATLDGWLKRHLH